VTTFHGNLNEGGNKERQDEAEDDIHCGKALYTIFASGIQSRSRLSGIGTALANAASFQRGVRQWGMICDIRKMQRLEEL